MAKTIRSACRNKHEDWDGFIMSVCGNEVAKKIRAIKSSKRYHKVHRNGDVEAQMSYHNEIEQLIGGSDFIEYIP